MKRILSLVLAAVMVVSIFSGLQISSSAEEFGDWKYDKTDSQNTIKIWDYLGNDEDVTVPSKIDGYTVTELGYAFCDNKSIKSVKIPYTVSSIYGTFEDCENLEHVDMGVNIRTIGNDTFLNCKSLKTITIPASVTSIGYGAFEGCSDLTSVLIMNNASDMSQLSSIGFDAFKGCSSLTSINIPYSVSSIGDHAFEGCSSLTSFVLGKNLRSLGVNLFQYCTNLKTLEIYASITDVDFYWMLGLGCDSAVTNLTIGGNSITSIGDFEFNDWENLASVTIGGSVTSIGYGAFQCCKNLTSVKIGDSVTSIGYGAFEGCSDLTSVNIPDSVTSMGDRCFCGCSALTGNISIPNSVESIGEYTFFECNSLTSITIPDSVTSIGYAAFYGCNSLTSLIIPDSVISIEDIAFAYCSGLKSITIPNSVTSIGSATFIGCDDLASVTIGNSVTSIGSYAFGGCYSLKDVFYSGTKKQWGNIEIDAGNKYLKSATIHCSDGIIEHTHSYTNVVTQPTCTKEGYTTHTCECGDVIKDTYIPALGHDMTFHSAKNETCTEAGNQAYYECSRCQKCYSDSEGNSVISDITVVIIPAKQHKFEANEQYCLNGCGTVNPDYIPPVPAHVHDYKAVVTAPKANAVGYTQYKCSCGEWKKNAKGNVLKDKFTAPTGKPAGFKCASRTATAEKFTWTKTAGASGYQVQISNAKGNAWGTYKVLTANSYTFSKLAAGHAYKARVRFYIKAADGKNYYGAWATINSPTLPAGTSLVKVTGAKKAFTAQWKKGAVTGYQLQYATNNKFSGAKTVTIKKAATRKYTINKLAANKTYYVRVRTYKAISGANYYSAWSAVKSVKTK